MTRRFLPFAAVLFAHSLLAQNLVPNPSFENYSALPNNYGQTNLAIGWNNVNGLYAGPATGSPDYFHTLGTVGTFFGQIAPNTGQAQMGLAPYHSNLNNFREYCSTQLTQPLVTGQQYQVSFFLTNGTNGSYSMAMDGFAVHFSVAPLNQVTTEPIVLTPTVEVPGVLWVPDVWQQFTYTFTADGPHEHITFGCFRTDVNVTLGGFGGTGVYYFLDDIEVITTTPVLNVVGDTALCLGEEATLIASGSSTYAWSTSDAPAVIISTDSAIVVDPAVTTNYIVAGDTDTLTWTVTVTAPPLVELGNDTTLCTGASLLLDATAPGATHLWSDNSVGSTLTVTDPGVHWVEVNLNGCIVSDTVVIDVVAPPAVDLGNDTTLCDGVVLQLDATNPVATYLWQDGSDAPTYSVSTDGTYSVTASNVCGTATDSVTVTYVFPPTVDLGPDQGICPGDTLTLDATVAGSTYLWNNGAIAPQITVSSTGTYSVTVSNACGTAQDDIDVILGTVPVVDLGNDTTLCPGASLVLDAAYPGADVLWQDGSTDNTFLVDEPGTFDVTVSNGCGSASDALIVTYSLVPTVDLGPDQDICPGDTITLDATYAGATHLWNNGAISPQITVAGTGTYTVQVTNLCGQDNDTINVVLGEPPTVDLGNDTTLCDGATLLLDASYPDASISWQDGSTDPVFPVGAPGTYSATVSNGCGAVTDDITIVYIPVPTLQLGPDTTLCPGDTLMLDATHPTATYLWHDGSSQPTYTVVGAGIHVVTLTVACGSWTDQITVDYGVIPMIDLPDELTLCRDSMVVLDVTHPGGQYIWHDGSTEPILYAYESGPVTVQVTTLCGQDTHELRITSFDCRCVLQVPNSFTPDGDGLNDLFVPVYDCDLAAYELLIFDRWGEQIHTSADPLAGWDGRTQGRWAIDGVYVWMLRYRARGEQAVERVGHVTLLR